MRIEIWGVLDGPGNDGNANCSWANRHFYESGLKGEKSGRSAFKFAKQCDGGVISTFLKQLKP